ncbi:hypothetical protein NHX12_013036, partial [Muraenolepis orangiensis]
ISGCTSASVSRPARWTVSYSRSSGRTSTSALCPLQPPRPPPGPRPAPAPAPAPAPPRPPPGPRPAPAPAQSPRHCPLSLSPSCLC